MINLDSMPSKFTLYQLIKSAADSHPNAAAQMYRESSSSDFKTKTFGEMFTEIKKISLALNSLGMKKGDNVGLIADVGHRWMPVSMGITSIGGVDVPRGTDATEGDLTYIFQHADCQIIFLETVKVYKKIESILGQFKNLKHIIFFEDFSSLKIPNAVKAVTLSDLMKSGEAILKNGDAEYHKLADAVGESDTATIIYTSGTTGAPKGVVHTQKSLTWEVYYSLKGMDIPPLGVTMGFLPPWHIAERLIEMACIRIVSAVAFTSVPTLAKDLQAVNPTFLLSVPRVWESFYNKMMGSVAKASPVAKTLFKFANWTALEFSTLKDILLGLKYQLEPDSMITGAAKKIGALIGCILLFIPNLLAQAILKKVKGALGNRIKFAISGAGALPEYIDRLFYSIGVPIIETYGMTETVGVSVRRKMPGTVVGTVGSPIEGVEIKLVDSQGNTVTKPNVKGVAYHRGPHIMKEYYKEPEKTKQVLTEDGWLNSGDILIWTAGGQLKFAGRAKDTIVLLGGENVEPLPIEDSIKQSAFVAQCVVVGQDQKTLGALILPDKEAVIAAMKEKNVSLSADMIEWNKVPEVNALFKEEIKKFNSNELGFKSFEKVSAFFILGKEFTVDDELTQTLKIKRNVVADKYAKEIGNMFK